MLCLVGEPVFRTESDPKRAGMKKDRSILDYEKRVPIDRVDVLFRFLVPTAWVMIVVGYLMWRALK